MTFIEQHKSKMLDLQSKTRDLRWTYANKQRKFTPEEWVTVGQAYVSIAQFYVGEVARAKHHIRDYLLGTEQLDDADREKQIHDLIEGIKDVEVSKQNIVQYESNIDSTPSEWATRQLNIEGEEYNIKNKLKMIKAMTDLLEGAMYNGR